MNNVLKKIKKIVTSKIFVLFAIGVAIFIFQRSIILVEGSDDTIFLHKAQEMSYPAFIQERYMTWSSRIGAESAIYFLVKMNLNVWKILNVLIILLFAFSANRIFKKKVELLDIIFVLLTFGLIGNKILTSSTFCFHGSFNYIWPAATGLFALIPLADEFFKRKEKISLRNNIFFALAAAYTVLSNEQMGLSILGLYVLFFVYAWFKKTVVAKELYVFGALIFSLLLVVFLAPGNSIRYHAEILRWYPDFNEISFLRHQQKNLVWFFNKFFLEQKYLVLLLGGLLSVVLFKANQKRNYVLECMVALPIGLIFVKGIKALNSYIFSFDKELTLKGVISYSYWSVFFLVFVYALFKIRKDRILNLLLFFIGLTTMILMWFSPTIYGSANRVMLICSVFLIVLINKLRIDHNINIKPFILLYSIIPLINLLILFYVWRKGFHLYY